MKKLILIIPGILIGGLITWHASTQIPVEDDFPSHELEAREELKNDFLDEQAYLQSRIVTLRKDIEDQQEYIDSRFEVSNLEFLDNLKYKIGITERIGEGLEIVLDDSPYIKREDLEVEITDSKLVQASDLRDIINLLRTAGVEGIAVNNQRVLATTSISSVGTTILVNNSYVTTPITISAVGDTDLMISKLLEEHLLPSIYKRKKNSDIIFEITKKNRVIVPIYNGNLKADYIKLFEIDER